MRSGNEVMLTKLRPPLYVAVFADAARLTLSADAIGSAACLEKTAEPIL